MEVVRVPTQAGGTLRDFYAACLTGPGVGSWYRGRRMLALLDDLSAVPGPPLCGMTSHLALHLWTDRTSGLSVCVHADDAGYVVERSRDRYDGHEEDRAETPAAAVLLILAGLVVPARATVEPPEQQP